MGVLAYNEEEGYALISGGQPTIKTDNGCKTGTGINNSGLWIFTREAFPAAGLVEKVRGLAAAQGFDLSVLVDIRHEGCNYQWRSSLPQANPARSQFFAARWLL